MADKTDIQLLTQKFDAFALHVTETTTRTETSVNELRKQYDKAIPVIFDKLETEEAERKKDDEAVILRLGDLETSRTWVKGVGATLAFLWGAGLTYIGLHGWPTPHVK